MIHTKIYYTEVKNILSVLKRACKNNILLVVLSKTKIKYPLILKILHNYGFIQSFEERGAFLYIHLKQSYSRSRQNLASSIQNICKIRHKYRKQQTMKSQKIQKTQKIEGNMIYSIFSTDRNIMSNYESVKKNLGGVSLFKIY